MPREDRAPLLPQHQRALGRLSAPKLKASPAYFDVVASSHISQGFGVVPMTSTIGGSASSTAKNGVKTLQYVQGVLWYEVKAPVSHQRAAHRPGPTHQSHRRPPRARRRRRARPQRWASKEPPAPSNLPPAAIRQARCVHTHACSTSSDCHFRARGCEDCQNVCQALIFWGGGVSPTQNRVAVQCGAASSVRTSPTPNPEV